MLQVLHAIFICPSLTAPTRPAFDLLTDPYYPPLAIASFLHFQAVAFRPNRIVCQSIKGDQQLGTVGVSKAHCHLTPTWLGFNFWRKAAQPHNCRSHLSRTIM